ncbi:MAG: hypothetical protein C0507_14335 [Cyanobacteria bacterium PR.3.49]|nr:hypothetical protein [Cyanobacteria bacterium PR.3.49]
MINISDHIELSNISDSAELTKLMKPKENQHLKMLHARWVLKDIAQDGVPEICQTLVNEGLESPSLRYLAGLTRAEMYQVDGLLRRMFHEFGFEECTEIDAAWFLVKDLAAEVESGRMGAYEGARRLGQYGTDFQPLFPYLRTFIAAWNEWDEYPEHSQDLESQIRTAAAALLPKPAPPSPGKGSDVDRLIKIAHNQRLQGQDFNGRAAAAEIAKAIPAGLVLPGGVHDVWISIGTTQNLLLGVVHCALPFGLIRFEFEKYAQQAAKRLGMFFAPVPGPDIAVLSLTHESIQILKGSEVELADAGTWLTLNQLITRTSS